MFSGRLGVFVGIVGSLMAFRVFVYVMDRVVRVFASS